MPRMSLDLGPITVQRIVEQIGPFFDGKTFFPTLTDEIMAEHRHWLEPRHFEPGTGKVMLTIQSWLVRTAHHTILVDTCCGNDKHRPNRPQWHMQKLDTYMTGLKAAGVRPEDIDYVMCTHLHGDHVGWNTRLDNGRWVPTFPNAKYIMADRELEYWTKRHASDPTTCPWIADGVLPIVDARKTELVKSNHVLGDHVHLVPTPGHSIDHFSVHVGKPGQDALITGDMVHSPIQCRYPAIGVFSDYDSKQGAATRRSIFERFSDTSTTLCMAHFNAPSMGRLTRWDDGFRFNELT